MGLVVVGAQADLNRAFRHDDALLGGVKEHGAVVDAAVFVAPGIGMGIEVNQRQRAVLFRVRPQNRVRDEVVAAHGQRRHIVLQNVGDLRGDGVGGGFGAAGIEQQIAVIDDGDAVEGVEIPGRTVGAHEKFVDAARMPRGPKRVPLRLVTARSYGTPNAHTSMPARSLV